MAKPWVEWPLWQRAIFTNVIIAVGCYIGLASSDVRLSVAIKVYIVVFLGLFMNLMFLKVTPRIHSERKEGRRTTNAFRALYEVLAERPYVTALLVIQLVGVSRSFGTAIILMQLSNGSYVRGLPNAHAASLRLMGASALMGTVAVLWLLGALGLWLSRLWAWWLVLVLNGLAAGVGLILQLFRPHEFLLDPLATAAVVLLLLRPVRAEFRSNKDSAKAVASTV